MGGLSAVRVIGASLSEPHTSELTVKISVDDDDDDVDVCRYVSYVLVLVLNNLFNRRFQNYVVKF